MHTSIVPRSGKGLMRGAQLAGQVDAGGAFHWESPCHCHRSGAAWHSRAQAGNHTEAVTGVACVCTGCFGLLNLEATLLSVIAHLPEIPPRTMIWAWITFTHTAVRVWGLIPSGLPRAPWWSSSSFYIFLFKNCQNKTARRPNNKRASLPDLCSASMQLQLYCAEWCMTWQQVGLSEGRTQQVRRGGLLRYPWGTALGREDETWHGVDPGTSFSYMPRFPQWRCQLVCSKPERAHGCSVEMTRVPQTNRRYRTKLASTCSYRCKKPHMRSASAENASMLPTDRDKSTTYRNLWAAQI